MLIFIMILISVVIASIGQLLLKHGMNQIGEFAFSLHNVLPITWKVITNLSIMTGLTGYFVSLIMWLMILSRAEVSYAYPMLSLGYIVTATAAYYFFGEHLSLTRMLGIVFVVLGVMLIMKN